MSPFLFDLATDAFNKIMSKTQHAGFIKGLGNFFNAPKVLNLHFAYDTLLLLETYHRMVENLKMLWLGFELVSGLQINFGKSSLISLNLFIPLADSLAHQLGCNLTSLPVTYLRVPLYWKKVINFKLTFFSWQNWKAIIILEEFSIFFKGKGYSQSSHSLFLVFWYTCSWCWFAIFHW